MNLQKIYKHANFYQIRFKIKESFKTHVLHKKSVIRLYKHRETSQIIKRSKFVYRPTKRWPFLLNDWKLLRRTYLPHAFTHQLVTLRNNRCYPAAESFRTVFTSIFLYPSRLQQVFPSVIYSKETYLTTSNSLNSRIEHNTNQAQAIKFILKFSNIRTPLVINHN